MPNTYLKKYLTVQENLIRNIKVNSIVNQLNIKLYY